MKLPVFDKKAKKIEEVEVDKSVFSSEVNNKVISQYVYSYLSNQRESNANTKDRAQVSGGGKKPWRQKGTGRARHGSSRSPLWKGGGVTFGPTNERNYKKNLTKSFKKAAFRSAFSKLVRDGDLSIIVELSKSEGIIKTKDATSILKSFGEPKKALVITPKKNKALLNAFSNIKNAKVVLITELSAYDLLTGGKVILQKECLDYISQKWGK